MSNIINNFLIGLNNIGKVFFNYAASVFVQTAVLVVVLFIIDLLLRKRIRAVFRYCIWLLVLVKLVLPPTFSLPTGIYYWAPDNLSVTLPSTKHASEIEIVEMEGIGEYINTSNTLNSESVIENTPLTANSEHDLISITWQAIIFVLWFFGVLAFFLILTQRLKFVRGLVSRSKPASDDILALLQECCLQMNVRQKIQLRLSEAVSSPAVCGLINPVILMPVNLVNNLSHEGLRSTLIHELAHIKRLDLWINFVQTILQVIYFYNPFVWFANYAIRKVCEEAVDETVLVALDGRIDDYSNTLIDIGEKALWKSDLGLRLIGVAESKKALQWRIKHMLNRPIPKSAKLGIVGILAILIIAAVLLPMAKAERSNDTNEIANSDSVSEVPAEQEAKPYESLLEAVEAGDLAEVKRFVDEGADINAKNEYGDTALHMAVGSDNKEIVELLIDQGADINTTNLDNLVPLYFAVINSNEDMVSFLVSKGADVNIKAMGGYSLLRFAIMAQDFDIVTLMVDLEAKFDVKDENGWTDLHYAAEGASSDIVEFFISKTVETSNLHMAAFTGDLTRVQELTEQGTEVDTMDEVGWTALFWASSAGQAEVAEFLINNGADVNVKISTPLTPLGGRGSSSDSGITPLHQAAKNGEPSLVKLLVSKGADINAAEPLLGRTPLAFAAHLGHLQVIEYLISEGADVNANAQRGPTPLYGAISGGHIDAVKFLLEKGAEANASLGSRGTLLNFAQQRGNTDIVELLREYGAKESTSTEEDEDLSYQPIYQAALAGHIELVKTLISEGANVDARNPLGGTPMHAAAARGHLEVAELLIEKGADVNAQYNSGGTPLLLAARFGYKEMVNLLISKGADVNVSNNAGLTPLDLAEENGHTEIVELLRQHGAEE